MEVAVEAAEAAVAKSMPMIDLCMEGKYIDYRN